MRVEEERHALGAEVAVSVLLTRGCVDLGVCVEVAHTLKHKLDIKLQWWYSNVGHLDIDHHELVSRPLKGEVTEGLGGLSHVRYEA